MKNFLFLGVIFILLSCEEEVRPSHTKYHFYENAILSEQYPLINDGQNLVFERHFKSKDNINIADDEYVEDFLFEVDTKENDFSFIDSTLNEVNFVLRALCECLPIDTLIIKSGILTGKKKDNVWAIDADLVYQIGYRWENIGYDSISNQKFFYRDEQTKKFSGRFSKAEIPNSN